MRRYVERAQKAGEAERVRLLQEMVSYEDPGPGGFYDDLGDPERSPHLVYGERVDASQWLDPDNHPSANTIAYTRRSEKGVTLRYAGLDPAAQYTVRLTMVSPRPRQLAGLGRGEGRNKQHVVANGYYLARDVEMPAHTARQFEYDIPQHLTAEGTLELWLENATKGGTTGVSEVWLIKK
jgi:hypothetical protein